MHKKITHKSNNRFHKGIFVKLTYVIVYIMIVISISVTLFDGFHRWKIKIIYKYKDHI